MENGFHKVAVSQRGSKINAILAMTMMAALLSIPVALIHFLNQEKLTGKTFIVSTIECF